MYSGKNNTRISCFIFALLFKEKNETKCIQSFWQNGNVLSKIKSCSQKKQSFFLTRNIQYSVISIKTPITIYYNYNLYLCRVYLKVLNYVHFPFCLFQQINQNSKVSIFREKTMNMLLGSLDIFKRLSKIDEKFP